VNFYPQEAKLCEKLKQQEVRLTHVIKDISKSHSANFSEQALERQNDEVLGGIGQETRSAIADIRAALARIDEGTYGICANCGNPINPDRLDILPATAYCIVCASQ